VSPNGGKKGLITVYMGDDPRFYSFWTEQRREGPWRRRGRSSMMRCVKRKVLKIQRDFNAVLTRCQHGFFTENPDELEGVIRLAEMEANQR